MVALWDRGEFVAETERACHGAGDARRITVARKGGGEVEPSVWSRWRHSTPKTASSRALPVRRASWRRTCSTRSAFSSSGTVGSCSTGRHISYTVSDTMVVLCVVHRGWCEELKRVTTESGHGQGESELRVRRGRPADVLLLVRSSSPVTLSLPLPPHS